MKELTLSILKGPSGVGKGTRVCQLIEYLKNIEQPKVVKVNNFELGLFFPLHGVFAIGTYVKSNKSGLTSWTSMDYVHATLKTAERGRAMIKAAIDYTRANSITDKCIVIAEGEPMFLSDKYRPEFIEKEYAPDHLLISYYCYENRQQYDERISGRSGVPKGGDSGWSRSDSYPKEFEKSKAESFNLDKTQCHISLHTHDETVWMYGSNILYYLGFDRVAFQQWAEENPMLRSVNGQNPLNKTKKLW